VLPARGGRAIRLTHGGSGSMPDWSPGGGRIVYVARLGQRSMLAIMDWRGRLQRYLPSTIDRGSEQRPKKPTWSPDGNWIAFSRGRSLELIHPDGTGLRTVLTLKRPNSFLGIDWQPRP
jgi:Tol biopolymer transport system component